MKLLHTADWHLNDRLGRIDRTADLQRGVERIARACETDRVDVLLIAGDLFSELARPDALRETVKHLREQFSPFLNRGGTILAVTGNHDSETFCQTLRHAMSLAGGEPADGRLSPGRFFLATKPTSLILRDPAGFDVSFALMPWPTATQYPDAVHGAATPEDQTKRLSQAFADSLKNLPATRPAVLVAHVNAVGAQIGLGAFRLREQENVTIDAAMLASRFAYVALGHVHKPQAIGGFAHVRYSGSIERLDLGEQYDGKGYVRVDIGPEGLLAAPEFIPLTATPIAAVSIVDPDVDLPRWKEEYADAPRTLVHLTIRYDAERHRLDELLAETSNVFPDWYAREWKDIAALGPTLVAADEPDRTKGFAETIRDYVCEELNSIPGRTGGPSQKLDELLTAEAI